MTAYITRRLLTIPAILLGVATIVFILMFIVPGDPARLHRLDLRVGRHQDGPAGDVEYPDGVGAAAGPLPQLVDLTDLLARLLL